MLSMDSLEQANALKERGELGRAIDVLEQAIAIGEESPEIYKQAARLCLAVSEVRAFANYCHEAMRLDPSDPEPHLMIAHVLSDCARWEEASEAFQQALRMPALAGEQREEVQRLALIAAQKFAAWKKENPGYSPLTS